MITIRKFILDLAAQQILLMPRGAEILSVTNQHGTICIWALVDYAEPLFVNREIYIVGAGYPTSVKDYKPKFIGTVLMEDVMVVWHVFDGGET